MDYGLKKEKPSHSVITFPVIIVAVYRSIPDFRIRLGLLLNVFSC